jgi:hypothetical protein
LVAVNAVIFPDPLAANPIVALELTHEKVAPAVPENVTAEALAPAHRV